MPGLYTGKGDAGTTKIFTSKERISKASEVIEALGSLDELNSLLGVCKVLAYQKKLKLEGDLLGDIVYAIQKDLFIVQAELAGSPMTISHKKLESLESLIAKVEKIIPPIKTFKISGGTELSAYFDVARTSVRRAERKVVGAGEKGNKVGMDTLAFLNRLSSVFYAFARFVNDCEKIIEPSPDYSL
ncbi:MAG: cob(I)yrinic acid a,c-diamide adenosyltransferase [Candidatus Pacebacteria bacterium]|nr:cob(I)yrinic acid a,c-diamide adenosyltransferase [Candidatus Paceibacterota bacterium]